MTYYLKYRPQRLEEIDLSDVRDTLTKIIRSKKIPHAFLFFGPKGSGKTSAARIIAKVVNCESKSKSLRGVGKLEPCNKCKQCLSITTGSNIDVIELDAASHRGIDDIRTLRGAVKLVPANANKKVYVIDEAHMLTLEASNALLKTLEEPPNHVMFILATTNPEKLIETIRSRTANIFFKKASNDEITRALERVVKGEKLKPEKGVLKIIAKASDGSFRDAVKILDQLVAEKKPLKKEVVENYLFQQKVFDIDEFLNLLSKKEAKGALSEIESAMEKGANAQMMREEILERLRKSLLFRIGLGSENFIEVKKAELVSLIKLVVRAEDEVSPTVIEQLPLEIAVIEWCESKLETKNSLRSGPEAKIKKSPSAQKQEKHGTQNPSHKVKAAKVSSESSAAVSEMTEELWLRILTQIRPKNTSTEALLRAARPINYDGKTLEIGVFYKFHKERLESNQHRILLEDVAAEILGNGTKVVCTLKEQLREAPLPKSEETTTNNESGETSSEVSLTENEDEDIIKVAKDIFGS